MKVGVKIAVISCVAYKLYRCLPIFYRQNLNLYFTITISCVLTLLSSVPLYCSGYGHRINAFLSFIFKSVGSYLIPIKFKLCTQTGIKDCKRIEQTDQPVIYMSNHQSTLDLLFLASVIPPNTVVIAKSELLYVPLMGMVL